MSTDIAFSPIAFPSLGAASEQGSGEPARMQGHAAGYAAGLRAAEAELERRALRQQQEHAAAMAAGAERTEGLAELLRQAIRAVEQRTAPVLADAQQSLAAAAIDLAEAIVGCELADGEASARSAVTRALAAVDPALVLAVRLHPTTLAALDESAMVDGIAYRADDSLQPGDAIAELPDGYLDARISAAVDRARQAMLEGQS